MIKGISRVAKCAISRRVIRADVLSANRKTLKGNQTSLEAFEPFVKLTSFACAASLLSLAFLRSRSCVQRPRGGELSSAIEGNRRCSAAPAASPAAIQRQFIGNRCAQQRRH